MATISTVQSYVTSVEKAQEHWGSAGHGPATSSGKVPRPLTVALTREAGTPGTSVAQAVGQRLNWPVYDHELLERIAREMGLRTELLESVDERHKSWLLESVEAFGTAPVVSQSAYVKHLVQTILSLGTHGRCVIVGRGSAHLLPAEKTLRVRLIAALPDRVAFVGRRLGVSPEEAARWGGQKDRDRTRVVRDHFQKDPDDPHLYDLLLNSSRWSIDECAELIVEAVKRAEQARMPQQAGAAPAS